MDNRAISKKGCHLTKVSVDAMKAMLLRVGIDKGTDGVLGPIFEDGTFEFIPISERDPKSKEDRTYRNTIGRHGKPFSTYLPSSIGERKLHFDPEFESFTYGDPTSKRRYLLTLMVDDILVFYAGLTPFQNRKFATGLYFIGFFTVENVIDFNHAPHNKIEEYRKIYANNAHIKRSQSTEDLVIVTGYKGKSRMLRKAILISQTKYDKRWRPYQAVSAEMERLLGISGSIQRSIPPRFIRDQKALNNYLMHILRN